MQMCIAPVADTGTERHEAQAPHPSPMLFVNVRADARIAPHSTPAPSAL